MTDGGSVKVILFALGANLAIGIAKFIGWGFSGSASLLAEGVHSIADCSNQALLLFGGKAAKKAPSATHPLGYGRESFFWSFVVSLVLFSMGGLFSIYEGIHKLSSTEHLGSIWIGFLVLAFAIVFEGIALNACLKEIKAQNPYGSLRVWFKKSTSTELLTIFTEDTAALMGLVFAAICLGIAYITGNPIWDAIGSIGIGVLLVLTAFFLARETKSLLIGESPAESLEPEIDQIVRQVIPGSRIIRYIAQQTGSVEVMVCYKILRGEITDAEKLVTAINEIETQVRAKFPQVRWQFVEPDDKV